MKLGDILCLLKFLTSITEKKVELYTVKNKR